MNRTVFDEWFTFSEMRPLLASVRFCHFYPDQCEVYEDKRTNMDHEFLMAQLNQVNIEVNRLITPKPDPEGMDLWEVNVLEGDCEDYALTKRKRLIELGWPTKDLRMVIVTVPSLNHSGHAVLFARLGQTDYILDNLHDDILPWHRVNYTYRHIQSAENPRDWLRVS